MFQILAGNRGEICSDKVCLFWRNDRHGRSNSLQKPKYPTRNTTSHCGRERTGSFEASIFTSGPSGPRGYRRDLTQSGLRRPTPWMTGLRRLLDVRIGLIDARMQTFISVCQLRETPSIRRLETLRWDYLTDPAQLGQAQHSRQAAL